MTQKAGLTEEKRIQIAADSAFRGWTYLVVHTIGGPADHLPLRPVELALQHQVMHTLLNYSACDTATAERVLSILESRQSSNGAWQPSGGKNAEIIEATAWAIPTLDGRFADAVSRAAAHRGRKRLEDLLLQDDLAELTDTTRALLCHALMPLARLPDAVAHKARSLLEVLGHSQDDGGLWMGNGDDGVATTGQILTSLSAADAKSIRSDDAIRTLLEHQNIDGPWIAGSDSHHDVIATASACLALLAHETGCDQVAEGINWLIATQEQGGGWQSDPAGAGPSCLLATRLATLAIDRWVEKARFSHSLMEGAAARTGSDGSETDLYSFSLEETWHGLPQTRPLDHTMFHALDRYVLEKLPADHVEQVLAEGGLIEVHGVYPSHFEEVAGRRGLSSVKPIEFRRKAVDKKFNFVRPQFFQAERDGRQVLATAVVPGRDYFFHYATILRHFVHELTENVGDALSLYRYPIAERRLADWSSLSNQLVQPGDRVLLGYVEEVAERLEHSKEATFLGIEENDFYGSYRYRLPDGSRLNLLGVKYSFWGSISGSLVEQLCDRDVSEILYFAKLGTLSSPDDIYSRIFVPDTFYLVHRDIVVDKVNAPRNGVLEFAPHLSTGVHVSVPTVLEEDYRMRRALTELGTQSIDNEITQMAAAIADHNTVHNKSIAFSSVHLATDYIRSENERALATSFDLGNDKTVPARTHKKRMVDRIFDEILFPYLTI